MLIKWKKRTLWVISRCVLQLQFGAKLLERTLALSKKMINVVVQLSYSRDWFVVVLCKTWCLRAKRNVWILLQSLELLRNGNLILEIQRKKNCLLLIRKESRMESPKLFSLQSSARPWTHWPKNLYDSSKNVILQQWSASLKMIVVNVRLKSLVVVRLSRCYVNVKTFCTASWCMCTKVQ